MASRPGKIDPDAGEPEKGIPDVGEADLPPEDDPHDGDEPFPPDPASDESSLVRPAQ